MGWLVSGLVTLHLHLAWSRLLAWVSIASLSAGRLSFTPIFLSRVSFALLFAVWVPFTLLFAVGVSLASNLTSRVFFAPLFASRVPFAPPFAARVPLAPLFVLLWGVIELLLVFRLVTLDLHLALAGWLTWVSLALLIALLAVSIGDHPVLQLMLRLVVYWVLGGRVKLFVVGVRK
jgi:hypothetical protein